MEVGRSGQGGSISIDYKIKGEASSQVSTTSFVNKPTEATSKSAHTLTNEQENPSNEEVINATDKLNKFLDGENVHAEYAVHDKLGDIMIKIVDNNTKEVLLEVPPKKILDMVAKMLETVGILIDKKA
jgi:flagellar protein FlaG